MCLRKNQTLHSSYILCVLIQILIHIYIHIYKYIYIYFYPYRLSDLKFSPLPSLQFCIFTNVDSKTTYNYKNCYIIYINISYIYSLRCLPFSFAYLTMLIQKRHIIIRTAILYIHIYIYDIYIYMYIYKYICIYNIAILIIICCFLINLVKYAKLKGRQQREFKI